MVDLSIHGYISKALTNYQHAIPPRPKHHPYKSTLIQYGTKFQHVIESDTSAPLNKYQIKNVQYIVGTLLYCGKSVDPTIVASLILIASHQAKGTEAVLNACHQLLD